MSTENYGLQRYQKFLLNRVTAPSVIVESIESCIQSEEKAAKHYFHKIMVSCL